MAITTRKCNECKQPIEIQNDDIRGVVYYKKLFYHTSCFCELAERKSQSKYGKPAEWKEALDNVLKLEAETKKIIQQRWRDKEAKDKLNDYLLSQYNVISIDTRFWQVVADLNNGIYKNKRCKKVSTQTLLDAWKWGQRKLNEINNHKKMNHTGLENDQQRILYDLAIIEKKIPNYLAYKAKQDAAEHERLQTSKESVNIDYSKIKAPTRKSGLGDISDLIDELLD